MIYLLYVWSNTVAIIGMSACGTGSINQCIKWGWLLTGIVSRLLWIPTCSPKFQLFTKMSRLFWFPTFHLKFLTAASLLSFSKGCSSYYCLGGAIQPDLTPPPYIRFCIYAPRTLLNPCRPCRGVGCRAPDRATYLVCWMLWGLETSCMCWFGGVGAWQPQTKFKSGRHARKNPTKINK